MLRPPFTAWIFPNWIGVPVRRDIRRKTSLPEGLVAAKGSVLVELSAVAMGEAETMAKVEAMTAEVVNFMLGGCVWLSELLDLVLRYWS